MYLGEVSNNELTHLDEEVAYISRMNWRWCALHKGVMVAKVEAMQMWCWRGGAHGWRQGGKRGQGCTCGIFVADRSQHLWADNLNSPQFMQLILATSSSRCVSSSPDTSPECMDDFASSQPENPYTVSSCKRYTLTSWNQCWKDGNVSVLKNRSPTMTHSPSYLLPLWRGTCNIIFTDHGMLYFPNFQQKIKSWVSSRSDVLSLE